MGRFPFLIVVVHQWYIPLLLTSVRAKNWQKWYIEKVVHTLQEQYNIQLVNETRASIQILHSTFKRESINLDTSFYEATVAELPASFSFAFFQKKEPVRNKRQVHQPHIV